MKKTLFAKVFTVLSMVACVGLMSCGQKKADDANAEEGPAKPKVLVIYYSQTGATKTLAEEVQKQLGADIEELQCEVPYEGDFQATIQRCQEEMADGEYPAMKSLAANLVDYDVIFLGYPVWFGTYARPIGGLLRSQSFDGMKVVPFCTCGSGGIEDSFNDLRAAMEGTEVPNGFGVRNARASQDAAAVVKRYLIENGYLEGEVEPLAAFGEHHPVTDDEKAIYHEACDDYMYPFGSPVDVASRGISNGTEYEFAAISADGRSLIYVTKPADGEKPYFSRVVRQNAK